MPQVVASLSVKLEVLRPGLTREEIQWAHKNTPGAHYCQAAVVLALVGPKALVVHGRDTRGLVNGPVDPQNQFEILMLYIEMLRANPDLPHAMKGFLGGIMAQYRAQVIG